MINFSRTGKTKALSLLLAVCMMMMGLMPIPTFAATGPTSVDTDDYAFDADTGTLTIKTYAGGTEWKAAWESFSAADVIAVDIQSGVTSIKMGAFYACSALTSVTIPASVTSIEATAFQYCTSLSSVDLSGVAEIGMKAFEGCTGLTSVDLSSAIGIVTEEYSITGISSYAFKGCTNLTSVTFPASAYAIDDYAFQDTGLSSIDLGGVTEIGENAFSGCTSLTSVTFPATDYTIGNGAFFFTGLSGSIDLGGVTEIGISAFLDCTDLTSVTFPASAYSIGGSAFCLTGLTGSIDLGGVTAIGQGAFDGLTNLTIILSGTTPPLFAIAWANGVSRVYYPDAWGDAAVTNYSGTLTAYTFVNTEHYRFNALTGTLTVKTNAGTAYSSADDEYADTNWRHSSSGIDPAAVTSVIIQDGVTEIGEYAFSDYPELTGLTSVTFPAGPYSIGSGAFNGTGLTAIDLGGVIGIGSHAFYCCASLTSVAFPESAYTIGMLAFSDTGLTGSIDLGGVTEIDEGAFYVPANLTVILSGTTVPTFHVAWAYGVHRVYYPAAWGTRDSVTNLNYNSNAFAIVDIAAITSLAAPVRGAAPVSAITETAQYTGTVTWSPASDTFAASTVYTATITLTPKTYYTLACVPENFFTVEGATSVTNPASSGVITAAFPSTSAVPITIDEIPGVTAPVRGAVAVGTITETAQYTGTVTWEPADNPFKASTVYTATITLTPKTGYTLTGVATNFFTVSGATSAANSANTGVITAVFPATGAASSASGTRGGSAGKTPAPPPQSQSIRLPGGETAAVTVDTGKGNMNVNLNSLSGSLTAGTNTAITIPPATGVISYSATLPAASLAGTGSSTGSLTVNTALGSVTIPGNMLSGTGLSGDAGVTIGTASNETRTALPDDVKEAIGNRPIIQLTLTVNGTQTDWSNPNAPVTVSIPYVPTAAEYANPESIVVWYIDGKGNAVVIPDGLYDPATGMVTFNTTHFSDYAVVYNQVSFKDVAADAWYNKAVRFIAAREITGGTGGGNYSPEAALTRGEFIVLLMRAYGIAPDTNPTDNFSDAGSTYYTGYLAAAKGLGITTGVGNNMYAPGNQITRQEMFTLLYNALKVIGQLPEGSSGKKVSDFSDASGIALWAQEAMTALVASGTAGSSNGMLTPTSTTTRAEMAQVLYNLLGK